MRGLLQMLNGPDHDASAESMARSLDSIETASRHLTALIDDTLLAAKLEAGKSRSSLPIWICARSPPTSTSWYLRPQIEAGNNRFGLSIAPEVEDHRRRPHQDPTDPDQPS